eukprot:5407718-Alexandrium_andersonii.AAC.1
MCTHEHCLKVWQRHRHPTALRRALARRAALCARLWGLAEVALRALLPRPKLCLLYTSPSPRD